MSGQRLRRALRVEDERVRDEVGRREIGLQTALSELWEVVPLGVSEDVFQDRREQRLGQRLFVGPFHRRAQILAERGGATKLTVTPVVRIERPSQCENVRWNRAAARLSAHFRHGLVTASSDEDASLDR